VAFSTIIFTQMCFEENPIEEIQLKNISFLDIPIQITFAIQRVYVPEKSSI